MNAVSAKAHRIMICRYPHPSSHPPTIYTPLANPAQLQLPYASTSTSTPVPTGGAVISSTAYKF